MRSSNGSERQRLRQYILIGLAVSAIIVLAIDDIRQRKAAAEWQALASMTPAEAEQMRATMREMTVQMAAALETIKRSPEMQEFYNFMMTHREEIDAAIQKNMEARMDAAAQKEAAAAANGGGH